MRLIGVVEADQSEAEGTVKNDRLIGVASASRNHSHVHTLDDLNANVLDEIEHFFISYNAIKDKAFTPTARSGPEAAGASSNKAFCAESKRHCPYAFNPEGQFSLEKSL